MTSDPENRNGTTEGYLRHVTPEEGADLARIAGYQATGTIAFATAFADLIVVEEQAVRLVSPRRGTHRIIATDLERFLAYAASPEYRDGADHLDAALYPEAVALLGVPERDQCFGFVPLLALGGAEDVEHLRRVRLREHLAVIAEIAGPMT